MSKIAVVGAGPGGLLAAAILSKTNQVEIFEAKENIGGRCGQVIIDDLTFTAGPTFISKIEIVEQLLAEIGVDLKNYVKYQKLDKLYDIYKDGEKYPIMADLEANKKMFATKFGLQYGENYEKFIIDNQKKFSIIEPILMKPFTYQRFFSKDFLKLMTKLNPHLTMDSYLNRFFENSTARNIMQFQSKYLGMSPHQAPSMFSILSYMEHALGIYVIDGGMQALMDAFLKIAIENGAKVNLNSEVKKIRKVNDNVQFNVNNTTKTFDYIVMNGDISANIMHNDFPIKQKKYAKENLNKREFSCSTYVYYLKLTKPLNLPVHTIVLSNEYDHFLKTIETPDLLTEDLSIYLYADPNQPTGLYCLVPCGNTSQKQKICEKELLTKVIEQLKAKANIELTNKIAKYHVNTPKLWEENYYHYLGANFNLSHKISQMLVLRPNNAQLKNKVFLVGGSTHPGSGLPTIFASVKIAKQLIEKDQKNG